jgi:hypothetical protein
MWSLRLIVSGRGTGLAVLLAFAAASYAQPAPDLTAQREAMKELSFLVGTWSGDAVLIRGRSHHPGAPDRGRAFN